MTEFEFDKESADRIEKTINNHVMCLKDCADILESVHIKIASKIIAKEITAQKMISSLS